ncbi:hypothetical protein [Amycolatopsis sp. NPDC058986]|uniref:hypothetical protein n=1 Tax=unclassified Amycolatopsis TaxID=2618356 RepID=UPI00366C37B9
MTTPLSCEVSNRHRPIRVDHIDQDRHVVHGTYGIVAVNTGQKLIHYHLTLTWSSLEPSFVRIDLTDPANNWPTFWAMHHDLLRDGGRHDKHRVDHLSQQTHLIQTGNPHMWLGLNRTWVQEFTDKTEQVIRALRRPRNDPPHRAQEPT